MTEKRMDQKRQADLGRRTRVLLEGKTTDMAEHVHEEPIEGFISVEQFEKERELLTRYPQFVGMSSDLAGPGSWMTFNATGTPILVTRDQDGRLRAMLNMCQHRGVTVVPPGCGDGARRFACPFHGWTYDIEGKLVGIPGAEGFEEVCREDRGMTELPAQERHGMMFVAARPDATFDVDDYLSGLGDELEQFDLGSWNRVTPVHEHHIKANWKVAWGTHCETYHFAVLHKNSAGGLLYGNTSLAEFYGDNALMTQTWRSIDTMWEQPEDQWRPVDDGHLSLSYRFFPNLSMSVALGDRLEIFTLYPGERVDETVALHYAYVRDLPDDEAERKKMEEAVYFACHNVVDAEDYRMAEYSQLALKSPAAPKTLVYGRNEPVMQHMAKALHRVLGEGSDA